MAGPKNPPARSSLRRNAHQQEEPPMRTRSGRGSKSAGKADKPDIVSPKASSNHNSNAPPTRKTTRSASNISNYANIEAGDGLYAHYEEPLFMVVGLTREFFDSLKEHKAPRKSRQNNRTEPPPLPPLFAHSEEESSEESDEPEPSHPTPTRGRGRGGRGSRGGRGRGSSRGRGRGGRGGRGRGSLARTVSPVRTRPSRNAAPAFLLTEDDDEDLSNQDSPMEDAKRSVSLSPSVDSVETTTPVNEPPKDEEEPKKEAEQGEPMEGIQVAPTTTTPAGSPPAALIQAYNEPSMKIPVPVAIPKISLPQESASHTPRDVATPAESAVPKLLDPEDDVLSDSDMPDAWIEGLPAPIKAECEDRADYLLKTRFKPIADVQDLIAHLTKYPMAQRSTETLYALAQNTQQILKAWQDEYLMLDGRTAPHAHPPKKACNGGRIPMNPQIFEDMKEADLYGYTFDPKKPPGMQDPFEQRPGHEKTNGRELRQRRTRDMLDSAAPSEDEEDEEEGRPAKRQRRATRKYDGSDQGTGTNTPKKHSGWGGARKKGVSKYAQPAASVTPEPDGRGKRGKGVASALLHQRIQEMREESAFASSGDDGSSNENSGDTDGHLAPYHKRGRPTGSKGVGRRSDYGIKKSPRKRMHDEDTPIPSAHGPNPPPPALQSISEGQNQFSIDPPVGPTIATPIVGPHHTETVFQATPQPQDGRTNGQSSKAHTPDTYMNTTSLSQYNNPQAEESAANSASSSKRKPRVKSEKRSQSMTIWWAERKARQKELEEKSGTPVKAPTSRSNSSPGKRGGRTPAAPPASKPAEPQPQQRPALTQAEASPPEPYPVHQHPQSQPPPPPPFSAPSPINAYPPAHYPPPPPPMMMQNSPLAAMPSGSMPGPMPGPPPTSHFGPGPRQLAPAPLPPQVPPTYPSPYGPRTAPRPKSSGPPPLAPAGPRHISPYPPLGAGPVAHREMPFKVMIPGPPPADQRRLSR